MSSHAMYRKVAVFQLLTLRKKEEQERRLIGRLYLWEIEFSLWTDAWKSCVYNMMPMYHQNWKDLTLVYLNVDTI